MFVSVCILLGRIYLGSNLLSKSPPDLLGGPALLLELGLHRRQLLAHELADGLTEAVAVLVEDGAAANVWGDT